MKHMAQEHDKGDIDVQIDTGKFKGDFQFMAQGVNAMVGGHIAVKKKAMACIKEFGEGNFAAPLEPFPATPCRRERLLATPRVTPRRSRSS